MATVADLQSLGYEVGLASPGILYVAGFGFSSYIQEDDVDAVTALADPELHAERLRQFEGEASLLTADLTSAVMVPQLPKTASLADVIARLNELTG